MMNELTVEEMKLLDRVYCKLIEQEADTSKNDIVKEWSSLWKKLLTGDMSKWRIILSPKECFYCGKTRDRWLLHVFQVKSGDLSIDYHVCKEKCLNDYLASSMI